ncbi:MAG: EscU/YscU/HrcU family type III secretion system export apparatus switch protein [Alphaproteobacteria bacterium]
MTPVAIALHYAMESDPAPRITASGRGRLARQILALAWERGIKVREDADLAELLAAFDVDSEIPLEAFAAVAEILSYVYQANGRLPALAEPELNPGASA